MMAGTVKEVEARLYALGPELFDPELVPLVSPELVYQGSHRPKQG